ncbi:MAG: alkaline phosphatase family protein [Chloroflexi bacterium]|nr:alkaline phosphatase family protein [Chloroflexota bacterium]
MLCIYLDAFKPEYLQYTTYLKSLAEENLHGDLETVLGFTGISATFLTGLYPDKHKVFAIFDHSPNASLGWIRNLRFLGRTALNWLVNLKRLAEDNRFFFSLAKIPLAKTQHWDVSMKKAWPQQHSLSQKTLFDYLRDNGKTFISIDWPNIITNNKESLFWNRSNENIFRLVQKNRNKYDFCFAHFLDLDYLSHDFSVDSSAAVNCVKELDDYLRRLDAQEMVIFSDHGMLKIKGHIDVERELGELDWEFGTDLVYFLDSTCARFWFKNPRTRTLVTEKLQNIRWGRVLTQDEMAEYRLPRDLCDLFFLADPGYLILPNFFQGSTPVKAMHGYDPKHPDQQAFYLIKGTSGQVNAHMTDMLPTILRLMGLPQIECDGKPLV